MKSTESIVTPPGAMLTHCGIREFVLCAGAAPAPAAGLQMLSAPRIKNSTLISLIAASRAVDRDIELLGALTPTTVDMIRDALAEADAA